MLPADLEPPAGSRTGHHDLGIGDLQEEEEEEEEVVEEAMETGQFDDADMWKKIFFGNSNGKLP